MMLEGSFVRRFVVVAFGVVLFSSGLGPVPLVQGAERRPPPTIARDVQVQSTSAREARRDLTLPIRTNMLAISWDGAKGTAEIKTRTPGGRWSAWTPVELNDNGPDPGENAFDRQVTEPVWVGTADAIKVRVHGADGDVRDVKLHLINTLGNARSQGIVARVGGLFTSLFRSAPAAEPASAAPTYPGIIWRKSWGANESWRRSAPRYASSVELGFVHHTATENSYSASEVSAIIRGIYHSHVFGRGYDDIAYNFLIDRYGRIFEGRAGGIDKPVIGGHTAGMNSRTFGVALIGTFDRSSPPAAMTAALEKLLAWKLDVHHVPPTGKIQMTSAGSERYDPGTKVWMNRISGHRDAQATGCPGSRVYNNLNTIRGHVSAMGLPKIYVTERPGQVLRPDGDGIDDTFALKAWFSPKVNWRVTFSDVTGAVKKVYTGNSYSASVGWDGTDGTGLLGKTGIGSWKVEAWDSANRYATAASGRVYLIADHPDGTLLQSGTTRVFVEGGAAKSVSDEVAKSWFRTGETVLTGAQELARYGPATPLGWRDGTILKASDGGYHFVAGGIRHAFESLAVFGALGYKDVSAIPVSNATLTGIPSGPKITDQTVHPDGAVVTDPSGVAWVISGGQRHSTRFVNIRKSWYRDAEVVPATSADLALPSDGMLTFRPGTLFRSPDGRSWLASGGTRRQFADETIMGAMGYKTSSALWVSYLEAGTLPAGTRIG
jgi:N-acetylmuramoyl-L-alanine amidase-like protein